MNGMKKARSLLFVPILLSVFNIQSVRAEYQLIVILPTGQYQPPDAPISRDANTNVYTFTDNIAYPDYIGIEVQKSGITVNGNGYTLQGPGKQYAGYTGFDLSASAINGVTIKNAHVSDFYWGVSLAGSAYDNVIYRNTVRDCNTGVVIGLHCYNNRFYHNNFIDNPVQVSINDQCLGTCNNIWDFSSVTEDAYVSGGNYWSDHRFVCDMKAGLDQNIQGSDGICDRQYEIDADNIDHFPSLYSYERSVHNTETGVDYFTIQEAIDAAGPGDIIRASARYPQYPDSVGWPELGAFVDEWLCGSLAHSDPDCWTPCAAPDWCSGADLDHSGEVNFPDFALVAQAWLAQHNPSPPYYENIDLNELLWLIGDGADDTTIDGIRKRSIQQPDYADHVVEITGNHTRIEGFAIQNAADANCGVYLDQSQYNCIISNTIADSTYGVGFFNSSHYNTVVDSHISDAEAGVVIYESNNVLVGQTRVYSNNTGISLVHSHNTQVVDNNLGSDNYAYAGVGIYGNCRDNNIRGNYTSPDTRYGIYVNAANMIEDANNTITANIIDSNEYGIELTRTSDNTMSNNQISSRYGVKLWLAANSIVLGNVMQSNTGGACGIVLQDSNDVNCTENEISGNFCGIRVTRCRRSNFNVNHILNNSGYGLEIFSSDCNIVGNIVKANNGGISIIGSFNRVIRNAITENNTGIRVNGTDNRIYRNILVNAGDNGVAYEYQENQWDDGGSPARGNFWGDYANRYPDAEPQHGSLIWDTPYRITDTNNVDNGPVILTSFEITKPVKPEMKKPYILGVKLTNETKDFWDPGMDVDFCGVEQTDAHPPGTSALWPWDWEVYEPDHLQTYEISPCITLHPNEPGRTAERNMTFTNDWHWIEPMDWKDVIMDIILGEVSTAYSIAGFIQDCYQAYCAVPSVTYTFMPYESPLVVFSTDVTVTVPYEKQESLHASVVAEALSIVYDILAAACATNPFTAPAAPALKAIAIVHTAISIASYYQAEDPSENYTELVRLEDFVVPVPYEVNSLPVDSSPEGIAGRLALAALELASVEHACKESYARYDYAKTAQAGEPNADCMALQLAAAKRYNAMAITKLQQIQFLSAVLTAHPDMPAPNDTHLNTVRSDVANGLYPIQKEILDVFDYNDPSNPNDPNEADIVEVMLAATETPERIGLYGDPNKLHEYHHSIIQDHYIADYALRAAAEAEDLTDLINSRYPNDVAVRSVWTSACQVLLGSAIDITVEVENHGTGPETFDVNVYAGTIALQPAAVNDLPPGQKHTLAFTWDITDVNVGYYTIQAQASLRDVNDSFPADNTCRGRTIKVWDPFDTLAPSPPENLTATEVKSASVSLSWTAPPEEDLAGYKVYRSLQQEALGTHIGYAADTYYTDTAVSVGTYWYSVKAYDVTGRESPPCQSDQVNVP